ncbi:MAG: hypothetical protein A2Y88_13090 [Chloroflexi bacterium RBG_13_48_10]|nr:MAG: hypothetical protein A2Y88_13090 [Chloroflexi bacterium RBG_13_48_10]
MIEILSFPNLFLTTMAGTPLLSIRLAQHVGGHGNVFGASLNKQHHDSFLGWFSLFLFYLSIVSSI